LNKDSKIATITYDTAKTNQDEILKRIALAGYDSENFLRLKRRTTHFLDVANTNEKGKWL
jgi:hypothetical protein